jgi:hypothetical protein
MDLGAVAPATTLNSQVQAELTDSASSHSQRSVAKQVLNVKCIEEPVRTSKNNMTTWKPPFEVEEGFEGSLKEIIRRADLVRAPWNATPLPTGSARYGTTEELFGRLQQAIAGLACLPEQTSALLTYWTISTWFPDGLSLAPGLSIVAPEFEGDLVLRTLRNFCRFPMILTRADTTSLLRANWHTTPTLLFFDPNISKQMVATLRAQRDCAADCAGPDVRTSKSKLMAGAGVECNRLRAGSAQNTRHHTCGYEREPRTDEDPDGQDADHDE